MKIDLDKIKIAQRFRKKITMIDELAEDIRKNGLINPITVMAPENDYYQLIAGLRRVKAVQVLGDTFIDATIINAGDAETALRIEISENEQRIPLSYSEKMDYAAILEEVERAKALERKSAGGQGGIKEDMDHGPHLQKGKTREIVGAKIGMSGRQYDRAKFVADNASPDIINQIDNGERSIRGVYDELQAVSKIAEKPIEETKEKAAYPVKTNNTQAERIICDNSEEMRNKNTHSVTKNQLGSILEPKKDSIVQQDNIVQPEQVSVLQPQQGSNEEISDNAHKKLKKKLADAEFKIARLEEENKKLLAQAGNVRFELDDYRYKQHNEICQRDSIIDWYKNRTAALEKELLAAESRIKELEETLGIQSSEEHVL